MSAADLLDALCARSGIVCAVGAGGKKTTLYRLLRAHPGRVGLTATTFIRAFPANLPAQVLVEESDRIVAAVLDASTRSPRLAYACPSNKPDRYAGVAPVQVAECHRRGRFDLTLVKADGARMRWLKAPREGEPNLVPGAATVLGVISARVIGLPLTARHVHRPERVAAVADMAIDEVLTPRHLARLIASEDGLLRGCGDARVVPIINMADAEPWRSAAVKTARIALELSDRYDRVVVAAMTDDAPIVEVLTRTQP